MARRRPAGEHAGETELDTTGINEPQFTDAEMADRMRRIMAGSKKGGAKTREAFRYLREKYGPNWVEQIAKEQGMSEGGGGEHP